MFPMVEQVLPKHKKCLHEKHNAVQSNSSPHLLFPASVSPAWDAMSFGTPQSLSCCFTQAVYTILPIPPL